MHRFQVGGAAVELVRGDITRGSVVGDLDAIANAANSHLVRGGGVDGAIHDAAGPELARALEAVRASLPNGILLPGSAVITPGFRLPVRRVVHCVGPVYAREGDRAAALLQNAYREALRICREHEIASVAFPAISTGVYGYPLDEAARLAWDAVATDLRAHRKPDLVRFVLFDERSLAAFLLAARRAGVARPA